MNINCNGTMTTCEENSNIDPQTVKDIGWLPLVCLIVYSSAFSLGLGPLPRAMNAEMFPQEAKVKGSSLMTLFNWLCAFFVTKFTKNINDGISPSGSYFLFGSIMFLSTLFVIFLTPETKGKTNEDMRNYFLEKAGRPIQKLTEGTEKSKEETGVFFFRTDSVYSNYSI